MDRRFIRQPQASKYLCVFYEAGVVDFMLKQIIVLQFKVRALQSLNVWLKEYRPILEEKI
jgi:hypothetical protein